MEFLESLYKIKAGSVSRSISAENPQGEVGIGGQAASNLGPGRKGRPQITLPQGKETVLADIEGPGLFATSGSPSPTIVRVGILYYVILCSDSTGMGKNSFSRGSPRVSSATGSVRRLP